MASSSGRQRTQRSENDENDASDGTSSAIKVIIRARPPNAKELANKSPVIVNVNATSVQLTHPAAYGEYKSLMTEDYKSMPSSPSLISSDPSRTFHFDRCFGFSMEASDQETGHMRIQDIDRATNMSNQEAIFHEVGNNMIESAFAGFHCTVLAYGQTGSGKTFTMYGQSSDGQEGLIPRVCEAFFKELELRRAKHGIHSAQSQHYSDMEQQNIDSQSSTLNNSDGETKVLYSVSVSYYEIYNEKVIDLLEEERVQQANLGLSPVAKQPSRTASLPLEDKILASRPTLKIREHPATGPFVEGLTSQLVQSYADIAQRIAIGEKCRTVASTFSNAESSRSHAIFTITLTQTCFDPITQWTHDKVSKISLVDLAGSERASVSGTSGVRLKEGGMINQSLTTLGRVISALSRQSGDRIPYRDSTLTWLLKDSLGGNAKTTMIAMISPAAENYDETMSTLRYADSAKKIINRVTINEDANAKMVRKLREELADLRQTLERTKLETEHHWELEYQRCLEERDTRIVQLQEQVDTLKMERALGSHEISCMHLEDREMVKEYPANENLDDVLAASKKEHSAIRYALMQKHDQDGPSVEYTLKLGTTIVGNRSAKAESSAAKEFISATADASHDVHASNNIFLQGNSICASHAAITVIARESVGKDYIVDAASIDSGVRIELSQLDPQALILVNGEPLTTPTTLYRNDCIQFGQSLTFQLFVFAEAESNSEESKQFLKTVDNESIREFHGLCQHIGLPWKAELQEFSKSVLVAKWSSSDKDSCLVWDEKQFAEKFELLQKISENKSLKWHTIPSSSITSPLAHQPCQDRMDYECQNNEKIDICRNANPSLLSAEGGVNCSRLHGYAHMLLTRIKLARAAQHPQQFSLFTFDVQGQRIGTVKVCVSKKANEPYTVCIEHIVFTANAMISEFISVIVKLSHQMSLSSSFVKSKEGDRCVNIEFSWDMKDTTKSTALLIEVWGHGSLALANKPPIMGRIPRTFLPSRLDFFVSIDMEECDSDGKFQPVAVKTDGTLRLHANQQRRLTLSIVQADAARFCLDKIVLAMISPPLHCSASDMWKDANDPGKLISSTPLLSLFHASSIRSDSHCSGVNVDPSTYKASSSGWEPLEFVNDPGSDLNVRALTASMRCEAKKTNVFSNEKVDGKKSRTIFYLAVAFLHQSAVNPIVISKGVVTKICSPVRPRQRWNWGRGLQHTRTAWWSREKYSRNHRLGTWYIAEMLIQEKDPLVSHEHLCDDVQVARESLIMHVHGIEYMRLVMYLEMVRQELDWMIPQKSAAESVEASTKNIEMLKKMYEKNIDNNKLCITMEKEALYLHYKECTDAKLCLTDHDQMSVSDIATDSNYWITESAQLIPSSSETKAIDSFAYAPWLPRVGEMCGFLMANVSMRLGTAASALISTGISMKWQRRWFVLRRPFLYAYKSIARKEQIGILDISKCQIIVPQLSSTSARRASLPFYWKSGHSSDNVHHLPHDLIETRHSPFTFQLLSPNSTDSVIWSLRASSSAEVCAWLVAIDPLKMEACNALRPIPTPSDLPAVTA